MRISWNGRDAGPITEGGEGLTFDFRIPETGDISGSGLKPLMLKLAAREVAKAVMIFAMPG